MKIHEKIEQMLKAGDDFGIYFLDGQHEEICISGKYKLEVTEEYLYYKDMDEDASMGEVIFPLDKIQFIRSI